MIKRFDRNTCNALQAKVIDALKALAEEHGLTVRGVGGSFSGTGFTTKIEFSMRNAETGIGGPEADAFQQLARSYGLRAEDLGRKFMAGGATHTVVGCKPRATKKPILTSTADGKRYQWPQEMVKLYLDTRAIT